MSAALSPPARRPYRTLVLNADHRPMHAWPLSLRPAEEAVATVCRNRADIIEAWPDAVFRSPSITIPVPKVIVLRAFTKVHATPKFCRRSVLLRDRYCCQYCGQRFASHELTFDHVIPRCAGGQTVWENILMACIPCNTAKRDSLPTYGRRAGRYSVKPLRAPRQPTTAELLRAGLEFLDAEVREDWGSWLYWSAELKA